MSIKRKVLSTIIAFVFVFTSLLPISTSVVQATGNIYYVSTAGSDTNDGSSGSPWGTILYASKQLTAGDTVIISGGTYAEDSIWSSASGTEQAPITIKAADGEAPIITGSGLFGQIIHLSVTNKYFVIDGINLLNTSKCGPVSISDSQYITIKNCTFKNNINDTGSWMTVNLASYITIENCLLDTTGGQLINGGDGEGEGIYVNAGNHILIQNNHFIKCGHYATDLKDNNNAGATTSYNNVIRNNFIEQYWGGGIGMIFGANHNTIENNIIYYAGAECTYPKTGIQIAADKNIIRNNIIGWSSDSSRGGMVDGSMGLLSYPLSGMNQNCLDNRIYNNISYKAGGIPIGVSEKLNTSVSGNKVLNNIFYYNRISGTTSGNYWYLNFDTGGSDFSNQWTTDFPRNNSFYNNIWKHADATNTDYSDIRMFHFDGGRYPLSAFGKTLDEMQNDYPLYFHGNKEEAPAFVNADEGDFRVNAGSPAIDAGANLALTSNAGTDVNTVTVDDSLFFTDGYGIITGDSIIIEGNQPVIITNVDYTTNVLTLSSPVTYVIGASVNTAFKGAGPDIGSLEYDSSSTPMPIRPTLLPMPTPTPVPTPTPIQTVTATPIPTAAPTLSPNEKLYNFDGYNKGTGVNKFTSSDGTPMTLNGVATQAWRVYGAKNICTDRGANDAYVSYKFEGTRIKLYAENGNFCGIAAISILDENNEIVIAEQDYDFYNATHFNETLVYTSPDLPDGIYVLKVRVTGNFNPANIQNNWTVNLTKVGVISVPTATPTPKATITPTETPTETIAPTLSPEPTITPTPFIDLEGYGWAQEYINKLYMRGILCGYPDMTFGPGNNMTRAEFATVLTKKYEILDETATSAFSDVPEQEWYYKYVASLEKEGLTLGNGDGTFTPNANITREEMFALNARVIEKYLHIPTLGKDDAETATILAAFADENSITDWARGVTATNIKLGLVTGAPSGNDMILSPLNPIIRAEVAVVLGRDIIVPVPTVTPTPTPT